ncbi:MAG: hypothetical protein LUH22_01350 [Bacteroides sp.]|nr:hypothetical protein [Bacteroides sp.]
MKTSSMIFITCMALMTLFLTSCETDIRECAEFNDKEIPLSQVTLHSKDIKWSDIKS